MKKKNFKILIFLILFVIFYIIFADCEHFKAGFFGY